LIAGPSCLASLLPDTLILDGEVCIFDQELISRFEWLGERPKVPHYREGERGWEPKG